MTTPEEVKAVEDELAPSKWFASVWVGANCLNGHIDPADRRCITLRVIEALDKVRAQPKEDNLEGLLTEVATRSTDGVRIQKNDTGTFRAEVPYHFPASGGISRNGFGVREAIENLHAQLFPKLQPKLPDLQVGDRFTMGDDLCEVVPLQQWDHEASIRFRLLNGHGTSLMLPSEIAKRATDFKRPVWEPVPTK